MIQWMHALSKSWVATLLMGALTLSFVVWGIADVFTGNSSTTVASIGGTQIDQTVFQRTYRNFLRNQSQQMGTEITPDMAQKMGLGQVALQQMVSRTALDNEARKLGLVTPDSAVAQAVRGMSAFRGPLGEFDHASFLRAVNAAGYGENEFLEEIRADLTRGQLTGAVESHFTVPAAYAQALFQFLNERRAADYVIVSPDSVGTIAPPDEKILAAYVKANAGRFSTPEYRDAQFAAIGPEDVMDQVSVTDAMIQQEYDAHKASYVVPEKRDVEQIEFASEAEAKAARDKIAAGTGFMAVAQQEGLKPAQVSLGSLAQTDLPDEARAKAIFALPLNQVSQPIKGAFGGWVLARVTKITPGTNRSLDDVREELRKSLADRLAAAKLVDIVNAFGDARNAGDDLMAAAKKAGMHAGHLAAVDQNGLAPDGTRSAAPNDPEFLAALFKAEVGEDGDPFATKSGHYYVLTVSGVTPPKLKPLDQVREQATRSWIQERRAEMLARKAEALSGQAKKDKSLDGIAKQLKVSVQKSPALTRATNDTMFNSRLVQQLFAAPPGGVVSGPQGLSGNFIIARVTGIAFPRLNPDDPGFKSGTEALSANIAGDFSVALANAARARQGVKVNQKMVQDTIGGGA
jgi:peptidyl-prolyl cis-trans isomerase D